MVMGEGAAATEAGLVLILNASPVIFSIFIITNAFAYNIKNTLNQRFTHYIYWLCDHYYAKFCPQLWLYFSRTDSSDV